ncbi:hypothetical protein Bca101_059276 [Brassica carinata]
MLEEFSIETRTKHNGSYVCEEAKTREEALMTLLGQNSHVANHATASLDDEYGNVFGPERLGLARAWASSFAVVFANIPNPAFTNIPSPPIKIKNVVMMLLEIEDSDVGSNGRTKAANSLGLNCTIKSLGFNRVDDSAHYKVLDRSEDNKFRDLVAKSQELAIDSPRAFFSPDWLMTASLFKHETDIVDNRDDLRWM